MRLSVCLIVRNEAARLPAALASVAGVADEIVVVDTGSEDETPQIARAHGARVTTFPWRDDFAEARNRSFDLATGDWILWLDADERLATPLPPLEGEAYRVRIVDEGVESWRTRLFRRGPRLVGRIHERFERSLAARDSDVRLLHEGYVGGSSEAKHRRNLPLLEAELAHRPERMDIRVERARTLAALDDPAAGAALDEAAFRVDPSTARPHDHVALLMEALLSRPPERRPTWLRRPEVDALVERWFPRSPPLRWHLAREASNAGDAEMAVHHLERLVSMAGGEYDRSIGFDGRLLGPEPRLQYGGVLVRAARLDEAERVLAALTSDPIVGEAAQANLEVVRSLQARKG